VFVKAAARVNNCAENSHQPTRERERRMRGFRDPKRTQAFLSNFNSDWLRCRFGYSTAHRVSFGRLRIPSYTAAA
jgi:hypothetical protein